MHGLPLTSLAFQKEHDRVPERRAATALTRAFSIYDRPHPASGIRRTGAVRRDRHRATWLQPGRDVLAVGLLQYGLVRALAGAVGAATRRETAELDAPAR